MNELEIPIIIDNNVSECFVKANNNILTTYSEKFASNLPNKFKILQQLWSEQHNAEIDLNNNVLKFKRKKDKIIFLLKWS